MIRPYFVVALLLTFILSCGILLPISPEKRIVYNAKTHVHKVISIMGGHCSSVYVNYKGKIRHVTNAHCCDAPLLLNSQELKFLKIDKENDLCELGHDKIPSTGIAMSQIDPEVTNIVYTVGYSGPYDLTISQGRIVSGLYRSPLNNQLLYRTSSFTIGGNSGGAAFNENGDLFGIVSQGNGLNHGAFIPLAAVRKFLD